MTSPRELRMEAVLRRALREMDGLHPPECAATDEVKIDSETGELTVIETHNPCDCWMAEAVSVLNPASTMVIDLKQFEGNRWDGEECGSCKHSSIYHANAGICTKVNCQCMKFEPSGIPNSDVR